MMLKSLTKILFITFLMMISPFNLQAKQSDSAMNEKNIVIKYDYSSEECLKASTSDLHHITGNILYLKADTNLELLGEKNEIIIPGIKECELVFFDDGFRSGKFFLYPTNEWVSLDVAKIEIEKVREILFSISKLASKEKKINIYDLSEQYFDNNLGEVINDYDLEHYKVYLLLNKFHIPKEIYPRDKHYFRLFLKILKK